MKFQLETSKQNNHGGVRKLPYAFTEEGVAMLATVLRTKVAQEINIENKIYEIRGKRVMLDSDLALLYGCANGTKTINLAVKRHINRFPERFMFRLDEEESKDIWFQIETKNKKIETRGEKYNKQYHNLKVVYNNTYHDRFFILDDEKVYHCGTSINRIGYKTFCINLISDEDDRDYFIKKAKKIIGI